MADRGQLTPENRAVFKGFATPEIWQQMGQYGAGNSDAFPSRFDMKATSSEEVLFLEMMMKAFKEQEDKRRMEKAMGVKEQIAPTGDPLLTEAGRLSGR